MGIGILGNGVGGGVGLPGHGDSVGYGQCCKNKTTTIKIVFVLLLCTMVLTNCVTTPDGSTWIDLNVLLHGKEDDISWTNVRLNNPPSVDDLVKLPNSSKEASNIYRYAGRVIPDDNTWYRITAKGMSIYYAYREVSESVVIVKTWRVYKSKYAVPTEHPTITPEELKKVELAYAETVKLIEKRGKRLSIRSMSERSAFIQKYQGNPDATQVRSAKNKEVEYYDIRKTSQEDIVALAKREANDFDKVRMIHDWVADVFAYDYDLLWWMQNVSGRNEEFTLDTIIKRQRGVCFEYAILFWFLLDAAGVDTYLITDYSAPNIGHAYNMVLIDNTGYFVDTTWDSGNWYQFGEIKQFKKMISKNYFMPDISQSYKLRGW